MENSNDLINASHCDDLSKTHNSIFLISEKMFKELDSEKINKEELLKADGYLTYSINNYNGMCTSKHYYKFKAKIIDQNNNLVLIVDEP